MGFQKAGLLVIGGLGRLLRNVVLAVLGLFATAALAGLCIEEFNKPNGGRLGAIAALFLFAAIALFVWRAWNSSQSFESACLRCGSVKIAHYHDPGSNIVELILWLAGLLPGFLYHLWRRSNSRLQCAVCGSPELVGADTPRGKELRALNS